VTLRAYTLRDRTGHREECEVVFARTAREARLCGGIDGVAYIDLAATRTPAFDAYAPGPVPVRAKLAQHWWILCGGCATPVRCHDDARDAAIVTTAADVYCDARCQARAAGDARGRAFLHAELADGRQQAARRWRDAAVGTPYQLSDGTVEVALTFPRHGVAAIWSPGDGETLRRVQVGALVRGVVLAHK